MLQIGKMLFTTILCFSLTGCVVGTVQVPSGSTTYAANPATVVTSACPSGGELGTQFDRPVLRNNFDEALLSRAVLHFTNVRRCANGVGALSADGNLDRTASAHSADMVSKGFFGHTSPVPGRTRLINRLDSFGVTYRAAAENLATRARLKMQSGRQFTVKDRAGCHFAYDGKRVATHTYRSLSQQLVELWEDSPGHRANLLNPRYTRLGTGGTLKPNPQICGDIVVTQNFAA